MAAIPGQLLSPLTEAGGSVVEAVLDYVMYVSTMGVFRKKM